MSNINLFLFLFMILSLELYQLKINKIKKKINLSVIDHFSFVILNNIR